MKLLIDILAFLIFGAVFAAGFLKNINDDLNKEKKNV